MTIDSATKLSHAIEYNVSKLGRTTSLKSDGYDRMCVNVFTGARPRHLSSFDVGHLAASDVHRDQGIEIDVGVHADLVCLVLGVCAVVGIAGRRSAIARMQVTLCRGFAS